MNNSVQMQNEKYMKEEHDLISAVEKTKQHKVFCSQLEKVNRLFREYEIKQLELEEEEKKLDKLWVELTATEQWQKYKNHLSSAAKEELKQWSEAMTEISYKRVKLKFDIMKSLREAK